MRSARFGPPGHTPLVSVVIVTHGGRTLLNECLYALQGQDDFPLEIIVVDSHSPDGTGDFVRHHLRGATGIALDRNVGFGAASNLGVLHATAPFVCFLNADVLVQPGWLEPLLDVLARDPQVGAVAPVLRYPDGSIQEAGSVLGVDGYARTWVGAEAIPAPGTVRQAEVDFASAACLLVRRAALHQVGGFSTSYATAYYEDADLAFLLRAAGWSVVVEPSSNVIHARHGSTGSERAVELTHLNRATFARRWRAELDGRPALARDVHDEPLTAMARNWLKDERVLVVDDRVPQVDRGSGDPRTDAMLRHLVGRGRQVTLLARDSSRAEHYAPSLERLGIEVVHGLPDPLPWLRSRTGSFDAVIVSRPTNFDWIREAVQQTQPQAARIYDAEALYHRRMMQYAAAATEDGAGQRQAAADMEALEQEAFRWAELALCVTAEEQEWARSVASGTEVRVLSHPVRAPSPVAGLQHRTGVVFFGGFMAGPGSPNELAALEVAEDAMPALRARHPGLELTLLGADPTPRVVALQAAHTIVTGRVREPSSVLQAGRLLLAPMRFGAGVKIKLIEAMANGIPFVTTPLGAEGLGLTDFRALLVCEEPDDMVVSALRLLEDDVLWREVQLSLLELAHKRFSPDVFADTLDDALAEVGLAPRAGG